jgi:hypothetical protein
MKPFWPSMLTSDSFHRSESLQKLTMLIMGDLLTRDFVMTALLVIKSLLFAASEVIIRMELQSGNSKS